MNVSSDQGPETGGYLLEDAQGHIEGNPEVRLVHDLADAEVARQAAKDVGVLAAEAVIGGQSADRVAHGVLGVLHQVWAQGADRVVALLVAARLKGRSRGQEVVAPGPERGTFDHSKPE